MDASWSICAGTFVAGALVGFLPTFFVMKTSSKNLSADRVTAINGVLSNCKDTASDKKNAMCGRLKSLVMHECAVSDRDFACYALSNVKYILAYDNTDKQWKYYDQFGEYPVEGYDKCKIDEIKQAVASANDVDPKDIYFHKLKDICPGMQNT